MIEGRLLVLTLRRALDLVAALLLVGLGQGLFLAGLLLLRRDLRRASTLFLAGLIAVVVLSGLEDAALAFGWLRAAPALAGLTLPLLPLAGVCLLGHVEAVLEPGWRPARRHLPWLLAVLAGEALALRFLLEPPAVRLAILEDVADPAMPGVLAAAAALALAHLLSLALTGAALLRALRLVRRQHAALAPEDPLGSRLVWLRGLLLLFALGWLAYLASLGAGLVTGLPAGRFQAAGSIVQVVVLYALGLLALVQPDRILPPPGEMVAAIFAPRREKYGRAALAPEERAALATAVRAALEERQLYRDPLLSLPRLAAAVGASPNAVSQAINAELGLGYHELLARTRVEAARAILADPERRETLTEILLEVGFNSKSVFNAAFRREVGMTPSAFRAAARGQVDAD